MTRILTSLIAAASFILPAAAFAQDVETQDLCDAAFQAGDEEAMEICDELAQTKDDIAFMEDALADAEQAMESLKEENGAIREALAQAKVNYRADPNVDDFYKVIELQKALNQNREDLQHARDMIDELAWRIEEAFQHVDELERALRD